MTTILLSAAGAPGSARLIRALYENGERSVRIVGTDMSERAIGRHLCDAFHVVPPGSSPDYPDAILELVESERVDVVLPQSSFDLEALSVTRERFPVPVLVSSAQALLERCGKTVEDVDVYIPHQANMRILSHAQQKLGIPRERMVVNVDRYGNTSSGSIPLALADAQKDGRLKEGDLVLMTGMGAGLTWGSALMEWTL